MKYIPPTQEELRQKYQDYCQWFDNEKYKSQAAREDIVKKNLGYFVKGSVLPERLGFGEWCVNTMDMKIMRQFITKRRRQRQAEYKEMSKFINGDPAQGTFSDANHQLLLAVQADNRQAREADPEYQAEKAWRDTGLKSKGYDTSGNKEPPKPREPGRFSKAIMNIRHMAHDIVKDLARPDFSRDYIHPTPEAEEKAMKGKK